MLKLALPTILAVAAGISLVTQQALNANLRAALNSAAWSGFMSYLVGVVCMVALALLLRDPIPSAATAARIPWFAWSGGLFGAIFIGLAIFLIPQLGAATFFVLLVAGQMLGSIVFDHFWPDGRSDSSRQRRSDRRRHAARRRRRLDTNVVSNYTAVILRRSPRSGEPRRIGPRRACGRPSRRRASARLLRMTVRIVSRPLCSAPSIPPPRRSQSPRQRVRFARPGPARS
jgi:transporter family-2 protein